MELVLHTSKRCSLCVIASSLAHFTKRRGRNHLNTSDCSKSYQVNRPCPPCIGGDRDRGKAPITGGIWPPGTVKRRCQALQPFRVTRDSVGGYRAVENASLKLSPYAGKVYSCRLTWSLESSSTANRLRSAQRQTAVQLGWPALLSECLSRGAVATSLQFAHATNLGMRYVNLDDPASAGPASHPRPRLPLEGCLACQP